MMTHRHKKSGGYYEKLGTARVQTATPLEDLSEVTLYRAVDGSLWVRPVAEFEERFEPVPTMAPVTEEKEEEL